MTDFETRSFRVPFELRMEGENQTIVGYASTFDQPYPVDMVTEIIDRSAFTRTLSEKPDVYALIGHDPSRILGRTKNGTLSLSIDERGLKCVITPVMTRDAEDTLKLIASGCIDAMSFGFKVVKQAFGYAEGKTTRRITDLELHEVSCVAFPANENATLSLRAKEMVTQFQRENRKTYDEVLKSTKAETTKGVKVDYTVFGTAKGESKGSKKVQQDAFDEAMGGRSAGAVETRADNSDVVKKLPQSIIHIKNEDGNIFAENIQTNDVIAVMTDDYDDEQEFYESQDIKDIKDVQGFADYLVGLGLVEKGDVVMSAGKKYVVRSTPATKLETRATPATEGQQALNVENLKAEANHAEKLVRIARATLLRVQADRMEAIDRSMGELAHLNSLVRTAEDKVTEAENYAKETYSAFEKAENKLRDMLRKGKKGNRSCNAKLLELRNRIAPPIDRK